MKQLIAVVQELSLARDLATIMDIVRREARDLTGADGATFVLRDDDKCFYAEENAISPLWKGQRFPMSICISGWVMLNKQSVVIEDIYADPRIPADAYRPTFVKSLAMVPIRSLDPLGAIGNYWATPHVPSEESVRMLQALADTTAVAMESVQLHEALAKKNRESALHHEESREAEGFLEKLTEREREVMALTIAGRTSKEIGRALGISFRTVDIHRSRVMHKTGAANLAELVKIAFRSAH